jgi:hypothetical protein
MTEWVAPWLDASGCVWVYRGYGIFVLLPTDHEYAILRLRCLDRDRRLRESEARRLQTLLDIEKAHMGRRRMADQLEALLKEICV